MKVKLFRKTEEYTRDDGVRITKYKPNLDIYIKAIDIETGKVCYKPIIEYSKHENLRMYKVSSKDNLFETFWVSDHHSLIVYDHKDNVIKKISPVEILEDKSRYSLIQHTNKNISSNEKIESNILEFLEFQNCKLVSCIDIDIEYDPNKTVGYDFTVKDYYTFCTYDGVFVQDTMAVFVPFTKEGIEEAKKLTNPYHPANVHRLKYDFNKDYKYGECVMLSDPPSQEYQKQYWWWKDAKINNTLTTEGRRVIYDYLIENIPQLGDIDYTIFVKKFKIEDIVKLLLDKNIDVKLIEDFLTFVKDKINEVITLFSKTIDILDFQISNELHPLVEKLDEKQPISEIQKQLDDINAKLKEIIKSRNGTDLSFLFNCGVTKFSQLAQLLAVKGLVLDPSGEVVLVKSNFANGLKPTQYFKAGHGARMGIVSRASKTAITGYLQRQMVYATASVELDPHLEDCGTGKFIDIKLDKDLINRLYGRYVILDGNEIKVDTDTEKYLLNKRVKLRTPMLCISDKLCVKCYGESYKKLQSTKVGFLAAEALGERFSQEMMKAFHTGGIVSFKILNPIDETKEMTGKDISDIFDYDSKNLNVKAKVDITLILDKDYYNLNAYLRNLSIEPLDLELLVGDIETEKGIRPFVYDAPVELYVANAENLEATKDTYRLVFKSGSVVFKVLPVTSDVETSAKRVLAILNSKTTVLKDPSQILLSVYKHIKDFGDIELVHVEVLLSQIMRCPDRPQVPYRLCNTDKEPVIYGIKKIPYLESWIRGLEFERISDAIVNGVLNPDVERKSLLDDLLL